MITDYYKCLEINRDCSPLDIAKAFYLFILVSEDYLLDITQKFQKKTLQLILYFSLKLLKLMKF